MLDDVSVRVGVDVGGTFTDLVALDDAGRLTRYKVASTPRAPDVGFLDALRALLNDIAAHEIALVAHASTIATNALLGQVHLDLPRVALSRPKASATFWRSDAKTAAPFTI